MLYCIVQIFKKEKKFCFSLQCKSPLFNTVSFIPITGYLILTSLILLLGLTTYKAVRSYAGILKTKYNSFKHH